VPKVIQALHNQIHGISTIEFDKEKNILFIGSQNGQVISYKLENYDEKIIPQYSLMSNITFNKTLEIKTDANLKITCIRLNSKNEILLSLSNGAVAIYSHEEKYPECNKIFYYFIIL
jgi:hypothetical protein